MRTAVPRVGVGLLVRRQHALLLVRRRGAHAPPTWSTPELGEHPADCAVRETDGETQVRVGQPRLLGVTHDVFPDEGHPVGGAEVTATLDRPDLCR